MAKADLTAQRLRELLSYDPETGVFRWIKPPQGRAFTSPVGSSDDKGYLTIRVDYGRYKAHRLAWLHVHGEWPAGHIDHINRDKADNRISNLRVVNDSENQQNRFAPNTNTSGHKGVHMAKRPRKWKAQAWLNGKHFHFGYFERMEDAITAYDKGVAALHTHLPK
jgi:hypothetical protein